ncbi:hypothetical protein BJX99DRAFT_260415 [Aspergillus californicus]
MSELSNPLLLSDITIPSAAGNGERSSLALQRTFRVYVILYLAGVHGFYNLVDARIRAASLCFLFPGAGLLTVASPLPLFTFVLIWVLFLASLFLWFACGALVFPVFIWLASAVAAGLVVQEPPSMAASSTVILLPLILFAAVRIRGRRQAADAIRRRDLHNTHLTEYLQSLSDSATASAAPGTRELDLQTLRFAQWFIETGLLPVDDWSRHTVIDQFQTAALRYQLYQTVYSLQAYQCHYAPNYSGALGEACRNAIHKAQCEKVNSFWKWECMWGKLNFHDWNPIKKDNIMVTGYYGLAVALYEANTRDYRFRATDSMLFVVDKLHRYKTNLNNVVRAIFLNMRQSKFTLYPCEPHWIYSSCNLFGLNALVVADRTLDTDHSTKVRADFQKSYNENFCEVDGSIIPIRSTITGFAVPGSIGIAGNCMASVLASPFLPGIGHRAWGLVRRKAVKYDEEGELHLELHSEDKIDPGNYNQTEGVSRVLCGQAAAEFGDTQVRDDCLHQLDTIFHPIQQTPTGSLYNRGLSVFMQGRALEARLWGPQDWANMVKHGVPNICHEGPLLESALFPQVLVAKAWSPEGKTLELVLYNGLDPGEFEVTFSRLRPGASYVLTSGSECIADKQGRASSIVHIEGRTGLTLDLVG